jgi:hypothetical protein
LTAVTGGALAQAAAANARTRMAQDFGPTFGDRFIKT